MTYPAPGVIMHMTAGGAFWLRCADAQNRMNSLIHEIKFEIDALMRKNKMNNLIHEIKFEKRCADA